MAVRFFACFEHFPIVGYVTAYEAVKKLLLLVILNHARDV
jgi:hypothetical protein